jgi:hypothetical protein
METSSPIGKTQSGLAALLVTPSSKKLDGKANQVSKIDNFLYSVRWNNTINHNFLLA